MKYNLRWRDLVQLTTGFMVSVLFVVWFVLGSQTIAKQNSDILRGTRAELAAHAQGSQQRVCALAQELEFFFSHPAKVNGVKLSFSRPQWQLDRLAELRKEACTLVPIP